MAGRPKQGIDYSGWSVDIFDGDRKIDKLIDAKGWKGFGIYFFLCQRAYKINGYFYEWSYDDCATTARKMGGGINSGTVRETVDYCFQVDLFDRGLFDKWGVLTSRGIQRRFWSVLSERRCKNVYREYWLLNPEECKGLVKVSLNSDMQPTNNDVQGTNGNLQSIKESKEKERKEKEKKNIETAAPERFSDSALEEAFQLFVTCRKQNGQKLSDEQIRLLREELCGLSNDVREQTAIVKKATISNWKSFYPMKKNDSAKKSKFNDFPSRNYDYTDMEKALLQGSKGNL